MQSLGGLPHQGDGGPGARPLRPADAGAIHRLLAAAGASSAAGTPGPAQPRPRDVAAGLETPRPAHPILLCLCTSTASAYISLVIHKVQFRVPM